MRWPSAPFLLCLLVASSPALAMDAPLFSVEHGVFDTGFLLTLTPSEGGGDILYSLDSSDPTLSYSAPLAIEATTVVRAYQRSTEGRSATATRTYLFPQDIASSPEMAVSVVTDPVYGPVLRDTLGREPSLSIVLPGELSAEIEREVSLEWIDPATQDPGFTVSCGAKLAGQTSLIYPKNSLRLYFRSDYGTPRLEYPLFPDDTPGIPSSSSFDSLNVRSSHDSVFYLANQALYLRNLWMDLTQLEKGHLAPHGRFVHVYLNGAYHGLYHLRERFDDAFMEDYLGGHEEDYEAVNGGAVVSGSGSAWGASMASVGDWEQFQRRVDVADFLDYMILNFYAANAWDWLPWQNWMGAGPEEPDQGGYRFHSSDSDICLVYPWDQNILDNPGPGNLFQSLLLADDPEFRILLQDRIHASLGEAGPLCAESAQARFDRLSEELEEPIVAESARWGGGWWERDDEWDTERVRLTREFFPLRTDELLRQFREVGWYSLDSPLFIPEEGALSPGQELVVELPPEQDAELWVTFHGDDPRLPGGEIHPDAQGPGAPQALRLEHSATVKARLRQGTSWGPLQQELFELDEAPPIVLNEWNAVESDRLLDDDGQDTALGRLEGNGGDWIELVVTQDHLDLRGWRLTMTDRRGQAGDLRFTDAPLLGDLRSGTILTIAEDMPEDPSYDPAQGDWRFHLRAAEDASGEYISAAGFDVSHTDWQLIIQDAAGYVRFGPVGEGVSPRAGISGAEVGLLKADPSEDTRRTDAEYGSSELSTFGAPNVWEGGAQDLHALRPEPESTDSQDSPAETGEPQNPASRKGRGGESPCGCNAGSDPAPGLLALLSGLIFLGARRRSRPSQPCATGLLALLLSACHAPGVLDKDVTSDSSEEDSGESLDPCFSDLDQDGYGDPTRSVPDCSEPSTTDSSDCDDSDPDIHPGAFEVCNDRDDDCDALMDDSDPDLADGLPFYEDQDGDGYGGEVVSACALAEGLTLQGQDCDDSDPAIHPGAVEGCDGVDLDCDGVAPSGDSGVDEACPASSCLAARDAGLDVDGPAWLRLPSGRVAPVWCDQTTDGGGWMLGLVINSVANGVYGGFGGAEVGVEALAFSPQESSSSSLPASGWLDLNALDWDTLRVGSYRAGEGTWLSEEIPRSAIRISFGSDGYLLYGETTPYFWCGGNASFTDAGVGGVDLPAGAPDDCKGHGSLGSGWDFSTSPDANTGLTLCGADGSDFLTASWATDWVYYPSAGGAQALWLR